MRRAEGRTAEFVNRLVMQRALILRVQILYEFRYDHASLILRHSLLIMPVQLSLNSEIIHLLLLCMGDEPMLVQKRVGLCVLSRGRRSAEDAAKEAPACAAAAATEAISPAAASAAISATTATTTTATAATTAATAAGAGQWSKSTSQVLHRPDFIQQ